MTVQYVLMTIQDHVEVKVNYIKLSQHIESKTYSYVYTKFCLWCNYCVLLMQLAIEQCHIGCSMRIDDHVEVKVNYTQLSRDTESKTCTYS